MIAVSFALIFGEPPASLAPLATLFLEWRTT